MNRAPLIIPCDRIYIANPPTAFPVRIPAPPHTIPKWLTLYDATNRVMCRWLKKYTPPTTPGSVPG
ncbi:MAG: hypothetical protein ACM359_25095, partial [Bacillota bacterium]